jgi:hypothetical protein
VQLLRRQFWKIRQHFVIKMKAERQKGCSTRLEKSGSTSFQKRRTEIRQHFVSKAAHRNPAALRFQSMQNSVKRECPPRVKVLAGRQARAGEQQDHGRQARALIFPWWGAHALLILSGCPPAGKPALEDRREHRRHARLCTSPCGCGGGVVSC